MASRNRAGAFILVVLLASSAATAQNLSQISLVDAVTAAGQRLPRGPEAMADPPFQSPTWLAALPSLGVSYLKSDEDEGTDETELSLNLPVRSPAGRRYDSELRRLAVEIDTTESAYRRLYLSGLVRDILWTQRIAATRTDFNARKIELLDSLLQSQQVLFEARSTSRYSLLLIRQELSEARIQQQALDWESDSWRQRFRELTGLSVLPVDIDEAAAPGSPDYALHPQLRLLELQWQREKASIAATGNNATPWNLAVTAKQLDSPVFEENQYGVALDIPINLFDVENESSRSDWQDAARSYWRARDELQLELQQRWQALALEAVHLQQQQSLLEESVEISAQLAAESESLLGQNELGREIWIRRLLGDIDKRADAALNALLIGQNRAMQRQVAGIPL